MPVLSPHRSSSSGLTGSYRSTFSSSSIDRPYYITNAYTPRITSYNERYTTRSYTDSDGRKVFSRSGSITEDGVTSRFREETRENSLRRDSLSRDSGISSIRENSILDIPRRDRDISLTRSDSGRDSRLSSLSVAETMAEMRNKYSPANYVPAIHRKSENISRSKSINDIGLPPIERSENSLLKKKVNDSLNYNNSIGVTNLSNSTNKEKNDNVYLSDDDNGNRPSVSEIRKKFDGRSKVTKAAPLIIEGNGIKISENRFKKQDSLENHTINGKSKGETVPLDSSTLRLTKKNDKSTISNGDVSENGEDVKKYVKKTEKFLVNGDVTGDKRPTKLSKLDDKLTRKQVDGENDRNYDSDTKCSSNLNSFEKPKLKVSKKEEALNNGSELGGSQSNLDLDSSSEPDSGENLRGNRTNNFASYISTKDYNKGDSKSDDNSTDSKDAFLEEGHDMDNRKARGNRYYDITTSPRLNRTSISQNNAGTSASTSSSIATNSIQRSSLERDDDRSYDRVGTSPVKHQGLNGLKNIGNTCFMNSVIQCLSNTKLLLEYVRKDLYISDINTSISSMKGALIKAFGQVIKELWSEDPGDRVVNTVSLKSQIQRFAPRFMGYAQQDAQEFLRYLLEGLHEDVNRVTSKPAPILTEIDEKLSDAEKAAESWQRYLRMDNSKIVDIFVGQLKSTLRCTHCGHCSVTFDPFWDLSLPIPQKAGGVRLSQCLEYFTREETLDGDEKPTCSKCKERRKCTKSFSIQKFPKILVIHLKRFSPTERYRGKLSVTVDFPLEGLDMRNYAADGVSECRYNLYAISNHSGTTYSGHYTAYCRHPFSHIWHTYNDSRVSQISSNSIVSGEAYVLFYELDSKKSHL